MADILNGTSGFDGLQDGNDLALGESGFTHDYLQSVCRKISKSEWFGLQGCLQWDHGPSGVLGTTVPVGWWDHGPSGVVGTTVPDEWWDHGPS